MKKILVGIVNSLIKVNIYFMVICGIVLFFLVNLQVIFRFFIHSSIAWSEELSRFFGISLIFSGATLAIREESHLGFDILVKLFPAKLKTINRNFIRLCILFYAIVLAYEGILWLKNVSLAESLVLEINMFWIHLPFVLCTFLMIIYLIYLLVKKEYHE
jgi:TRAP-type C4-dicarboxylate transport system permease small subunit